MKSVILTNKDGMTATLLNFGARLVSIKVPVRGDLTEMLVAYKQHEDYLTDPYFWAQSVVVYAIESVKHLSLWVAMIIN